MCGAMVTPPLPHGAGLATIARRHICLFVRGIRAPADKTLPGPPVTRRDIEEMFAGEPAS
jgi:hypothetical protein